MRKQTAADGGYGIDAQSPINHEQDAIDTLVDHDNTQVVDVDGDVYILVVSSETHDDEIQRADLDDDVVAYNQYRAYANEMLARHWDRQRVVDMGDRYPLVVAVGGDR